MAAKETGKRLPRHREPFQSQPVGPEEVGHHVFLEATFLRVEGFSSREEGEKKKG